MTPAAAASRALASLLHPLSPLIADSAVTEILVNGPAAAWCERHGQLLPAAIDFDQARLAAIARLVETLSGTDTLERDAVLEGRWKEWRVTMALPPLCDHGCLALRRHRGGALPLAAWERSTQLPPLPDRQGASPPATDGAGSPLALLRAAVHRHDNILVAGATGSGKTTLLASLLGEVIDGERLVCLEDNPELPLLGAHQLRLYARSGHSLRSLLKLALRLRPDRLVVGEVRGGEAFDLLQAMATGHRGCLGTIHASNASGALARLEQLVLTTGLDWPLEAVRRQVAQSIDLVVQVRRGASGREVAGVDRVVGSAADGYRLQSLFVAAAQ